MSEDTGASQASNVADAAELAEDQRRSDETNATVDTNSSPSNNFPWFWVADFSGSGQSQLLFYSLSGKSWGLGSYDGAQLTWSQIGVVANMSDAITTARFFWCGDFQGLGRHEIVYYSTNNSNLYLGNYDGTKMQWTTAGNLNNWSQDIEGVGLFWTGSFNSLDRNDLLFYSSRDDVWLLGEYSSGSLQWREVGATAAILGHAINDGRPFVHGTFQGLGKSELLFFSAQNNSWYLGAYDGTTLQWSQAGNHQANIGAAINAGNPFWTGSFSDPNLTEILLYKPDDDSWWLGSYASGTLNWSQVGNTAERFGHAINDGRPFWTGRFSDPAHTQLMFYKPDDDSWWLGSYASGTLNWSQVGNTAERFGHAINDGRPFWTGSFVTKGVDNLLFVELDPGRWWLGSFNDGQFDWKDVTQSVNDPDEDAGSSIAKRGTTQPAKDDLQTLITDFAPRVWLCHLASDSFFSTDFGPEELCWPSSTDWYIERVELFQGWSAPKSAQAQLSAAPTADTLASYGDNQDNSLFLFDKGNETTRTGITPRDPAWPPPCYVHVAPVLNDDGTPTNMIDLEYWFFYPANGAIASLFPLSDGSWGFHVGDWEHAIFRVADRRNIVQVYYSAHSGAAWKSVDDISFVKGTQHPVVFAAVRSHANYTDRGILGTQLRFPVCDTVGKGQDWNTWEKLVRIEWSPWPLPNAQSWIRYTGRWGQTPHNTFGDSPTGPSGRPDFKRVGEGQLFAEVANPSKIYVIFHGAAFELPSTEAFIDLGYDRLKVITMPNGYIAPLLTGLADRVIVQERATVKNTSDKYYIFAGGAKFQIPWDQLYAFDIGNSLDIPPHLMDKVPVIPRDGTLVRELNNNQTYLIQNGHKQATYTSDASRICPVPSESLNRIPQ